MTETSSHQIFDKLFKKILTLSTKAVINLINGLFEKNYSTDSILTYQWTEHIDDNLNKTIADTIITINHTDSYHMEAQMVEDSQIVFRVFNYGYHHAITHYKETDILEFPQPIIIYLSDSPNIPDTKSLIIRFRGQGDFTYHVPTIKLLENSIQEIDDKKMIILIPFFLLKLRKSLEKERTKDNMFALQHLILHDIIGSIDRNLELGNISITDNIRLKDMIGKLYRYLYEKFQELEDTGVNDCIEGGLILEMDIIEARHKRELNEVAEALELLEEKHQKDLLDTSQLLEEKHQKDLLDTSQLLEEKHQKELEKITTEKKNMVINLYAISHSKEEVSRLLGIPLSDIEALLS